MLTKIRMMLSWFFICSFGTASSVSYAESLEKLLLKALEETGRVSSDGSYLRSSGFKEIVLPKLLESQELREALELHYQKIQGQSSLKNLEMTLDDRVFELLKDFSREPHVFSKHPGFFSFFSDYERVPENSMELELVNSKIFDAKDEFFNRARREFFEDPDAILNSSQWRDFEPDKLMLNFYDDPNFRPSEAKDFFNFIRSKMKHPDLKHREFAADLLGTMIRDQVWDIPDLSLEDRVKIRNQIADVLDSETLENLDARLGDDVLPVFKSSDAAWDGMLDEDGEPLKSLDGPLYGHDWYNDENFPKKLKHRLAFNLSQEEYDLLLKNDSVLKQVEKAQAYYPNEDVFKSELRKKYVKQMSSLPAETLKKEYVQNFNKFRKMGILDGIFKDSNLRSSFLSAYDFSQARRFLLEYPNANGIQLQVKDLEVLEKAMSDSPEAYRKLRSKFLKNDFWRELIALPSDHPKTFARPKEFLNQVLRDWDQFQPQEQKEILKSLNRVLDTHPIGSPFSNQFASQVAEYGDAGLKLSKELEQRIQKEEMFFLKTGRLGEVYSEKGEKRARSLRKAFEKGKFPDVETYEDRLRQVFLKEFQKNPTGQEGILSALESTIESIQKVRDNPVSLRYKDTGIHAGETFISDYVSKFSFANALQRAKSPLERNRIQNLFLDLMALGHAQYLADPRLLNVLLNKGYQDGVFSSMNSGQHAEIERLIRNTSSVVSDRLKLNASFDEDHRAMLQEFWAIQGSLYERGLLKSKILTGSEQNKIYSKYFDSLTQYENGMIGNSMESALISRMARNQIDQATRKVLLEGLAKRYPDVMGEFFDADKVLHTRAALFGAVPMGQLADIQKSFEAANRDYSGYVRHRGSHSLIAENSPDHLLKRLQKEWKEAGSAGAASLKLHFLITHDQELQDYLKYRLPDYLKSFELRLKDKSLNTQQKKVIVEDFIKSFSGDLKTFYSQFDLRGIPEVKESLQSFIKTLAKAEQDVNAKLSLGEKACRTNPDYRYLLKVLVKE